MNAVDLSYNSTLNYWLLFIWHSLLILDPQVSYGVHKTSIFEHRWASHIYSPRYILILSFSALLVPLKYFFPFSSFDRIFLHYPHTWYILLSFFKSCNYVWIVSFLIKHLSSLCIILFLFLFLPLSLVLINYENVRHLFNVWYASSGCSFAHHKARENISKTGKVCIT
jgi:hypothetical protein